MCASQRRGKLLRRSGWDTDGVRPWRVHGYLAATLVSAFVGACAGGDAVQPQKAVTFDAARASKPGAALWDGMEVVDGSVLVGVAMPLSARERGVEAPV